MDSFLLVYLGIAALAVLSFIVFWGAVIYFLVKLFRKGNLTPQQQAAIIRGLGTLTSSGGGRYEPGPAETSVRNLAAREGIDLNR
jgi:hypothetical protein